MLQVTETLPLRHGIDPHDGFEAVTPVAKRHPHAPPTLTADPEDAQSFRRNPQDGWRLADPYPMRKGTLRVLRGLIRALCPPAPAPQLPDLEERISTNLRCLMPYMNTLSARSVVWIIRLLDWAPIWRFKSFRRLHALPAERAAAILKDLGNSRFMVLRQMVIIARGVILSGYYDQAEVHEAMNYHPRRWFSNRVALRRRLLTGQRPTAGDHIGPHSDRVRP